MLRTLTHEDFIEAIETGDLNSVQQYLAANADNPDALNVVGENGFTALMIAIGFHRNQITLAILNAQGILINMRDSRGRTALWHATGGDDDSQILKSLLAYPGIEVNAQDNEGYTALMNAVRWSSVSKVAVLLLDQRVDITVTNNRGRTAIDTPPYSARRHQIIVPMFADRQYARQILIGLGLGVAAQPINLQPEPAVTAAAYLQAAQSGNLPIVQRYLAANSDNYDALNVVGADGLTALMIAIRSHRNQLALSILNAQGILINMRDFRGKTAILRAASDDDVDFQILNSLLAYPGIEVNAQDNEGYTALMNAVNSSSVYKVAVLLLDQRVDITVTNNWRETAIDMYPYNANRHQIIVRMFADRGYAREVLAGHGLYSRLLQSHPRTEQMQATLFQGSRNESIINRGLFINAVSAGNQEDIEEFIRQNNGHPGMVALGEEAALIAQRNGRDDLAVVITQLIINDVQGQPANAEPSPIDELDQVDPNSFEGRLDAIGFDSANIPPRFRDPVHQGIIEYPMVLKGGQTIDRPSLVDLIKLKLPNPFTREPIDDSELERSVSYDLKALIEAFVVEQERIAAANREQAAPPPQENPVEELPELSGRERAIQARLRQFGTPADQERRDDATSLSSKRNLTGKE